MQANVLAWVLSRKIARDGRKQCCNASVEDDKNFVDMRCTAADHGVDDNGNPPEGEGFILNLRYTKVINSAVLWLKVLAQPFLLSLSQSEILNHCN